MATLSTAPSDPARTHNDQAISGLARLLATENIRVEHQPVRTAYFDTATRTLTLPIWRGMSADLYDMLVGHEVGHALWTPASDAVVQAAIDRCKAAGAPNDQYAKALLNIVEDARIERKIKEKFPGLRRNFVIAYRELIERDIFGLSSCGNDPNARGLVDRFNLYHKCGAIGLMQVDFTPTESLLVARGATIDSFEDTVVLCEAIMCHLSQNGDSTEPQSQSGGQGAGQGGGQGEQQEQGEQDTGGQPESGDGEAEAGDGQRGAVNGQDADAPQGETGEDTQGAGKPEGDKPEGESQDTEGKPNKHSGQQTGKDPGKGRRAEDGADLGTVTTDNALNDGLGKMADTRNANYYNQYGEAPQFVMDRLVIPASHLVKLWQKEWAKSRESLPMIDSMMAVWKRENMPTVLNMVKRFEQRKAADDAKRTMTAKSGRIDTGRLAYYKVSEDLFLSMTTTTDGKSHGLVMVVDWSGSMCGVLGSVLSQVLCLVEFCRKTGVPYEVYAFSDCCYGWEDGKDNVTADNGYYPVCHKTPGHLAANGFRMVQFLRDGMTRADHADAVRGLVGLMVANGYDPFTAELKRQAQAAVPGYGGYSVWDYLRVVAPRFATPKALTLNGTPLNEALLACADLTEAFRKRTGAQIVNLAVLTDGEASRSVAVEAGANPAQEYRKGPDGWDRFPNTVLRWGTKQYQFTDTTGKRWARHGETEALIRYLRDRTGARVYGFFLMPENVATKAVKGHRYTWSSPAQQAAAVAQMDAEGSAVVPHAAYDEFYVVGVATRTEGEDFMDRLDPTALSARKIANSFVKGMQSRSTTRSIMVRFADCFATGKPSQHRMR